MAAAAVAVGGEGARVHGLELVVGDLTAAAAAAREAWRDALARAGQYAALAGVALGEVMEIKEAPATPRTPGPCGCWPTRPTGPATEPGRASSGPPSP